MNIVLRVPVFRLTYSYRYEVIEMYIGKKDYESCSPKRYLNKTRYLHRYIAHRSICTSCPYLHDHIRKVVHVKLKMSCRLLDRYLWLKRSAAREI